LADKHSHGFGHVPFWPISEEIKAKDEVKIFKRILWVTKNIWWDSSWVGKRGNKTMILICLVEPTH
jgi:hypothetical protein